MMNHYNVCLIRPGCLNATEAVNKAPARSKMRPTSCLVESTSITASQGVEGSLSVHHSSYFNHPNLPLFVSRTFETPARGRKSNNFDCGFEAARLFIANNGTSE